MKIIVTGGCGFIGSHLVDKLLNIGHDIVILDNLSTGKLENLNRDAKFHKVDIRNDEKIKNIFLKEQPDIVFHLAAQINVRESIEDPIYDNAVNVTGSLNLIQSFLNIGSEKGGKFIFSSTGGAIYGETEILPTPETVEPFPLSPYGIAKLSVEKYLHYFYKYRNLKFVSLRYGNVYGPRQNPFTEAGVIAIFATKMLKGEQPVIFGDGNQTRDYVYIEDVVRANIMAMEKDITGVFNVGTGKETSVNQLFEYIKKFTNFEIEKEYAEEKKEVKRSCLTIEKIQKVLGWKPEISLEEGLQKTVDWFRRQQYNS